MGARAWGRACVSHPACACHSSAINVVFGYTSINASTGATNNQVLVVPLITLLPIPFLRVRFPYTHTRVQLCP